MNVQKILTTISDDECVILSGENGSICVDNTDRIEVIDGQEFVFARVSEEVALPVPSSEFDDATVMKFEEFIMHCMLTM